jgi:hypothetical protein
MTVKRKAKTHDLSALKTKVRRAFNEQKRWAYLSAAHEFMGAPVSMQKLIECLGLCGIIGQIAAGAGYPFRMLWYTPLIGTMMVFLVSVVAAALSARPVLKLEPGIVFAGR